MQRVFFDWSRPFLPQVASFVVSMETERLRSQSSPESSNLTPNNAPRPLSFDLGDLVFVLPGRRAVRTLEAYLQLEVERAIQAGSIAPDWTPPTYLTVGAAPEFLYPQRKRVAARPTRLLCMRRALREFSDAEPEKSRALIRSLPAESNWAAQLELAQIFVDLADELASENRDFSAVAASTRRRNLPEETERWESLGQIAALYRKELARFDLTDFNLARTAALLSGEIGVSVGGGFENGASKRYFVVGAVDLNRQQKAIFEALGDKVSFFIFAPESLQDRFDEFGVVVPEAWETAEIPIPDRRFFQVDGPVEQAQAAALLVRELSKIPLDDGDWRYEPIPADSLTIGVPDAEVVPFLERSLRDVGYETIRAQGSPATQNRVFQLLRNVADYLETRSFSALEELARRSDVEEYLIRNWRFVSLDDGRSGATEAEESAENAAAVVPGSALDEAEDGVWFDDELPPDFGDDALFDEDAELADVPLNINDAETSTDASAAESPETPFVPGDWLSEFDRYRATFLPTRVDGRWFEYKNEDAPRQNAEFRLLRKVALLIERALEPFCDSDAPPLQREKLAVVEPTFKRSPVDAQTGELDALKLDASDFKADEADDVFSGPLAFAKDDFAESFRWKTNQRRLPIADWAPILSNFLCKIYPEPEPGARTSEAAAQVDAFFAALHQEFDKFEAIPQELTADATGADAIRTILKELAKATIPPFPAADVVELQGWLDLAFDDAPNLILTGFNEGIVPSSKSSDLFLPNETRRELGLEDARRRFARDACLTSALAASKRNFFVVFGRRSLQNDPKTPSRFAFATAPENVPPRICRFFAGGGSNDLAELEARQLGRPFPKAPLVADAGNVDANDAESLETPIQTTSTESAEPVLAVGPTSPTPSEPPRPVGFSVPILRTTGPAPSKMKVTEFRDFLACPYRYFLRRALNLRAAAPETTAEMNAAAFGTLAHDALRDFGVAPEIRDSVDADAISAWLSRRLDVVASRYFNELSSPFVRVQIEQIRSRLDAFARWQALWRRSGRQIKFVEASPRSGSITFDVGGGRPVEIFGRLDRIDYDPRENRWFVFDYKTFDTANEGRASKEPISEFAPDVFDDETQTALFTTRLGNVADDKHRRRAKPRLSAPLRTLEKFGITPAPNIPQTTQSADASRFPQNAAFTPTTQSAACSQTTQSAVSSQSTQTPRTPQSAALDAETGPTFDWVDLQLPLYRRFFREILFEYYDGARSREDLEATKVALGYIVLTKGAKTQAFGGPWTERDLRSADATASRVVRTIRRLWNAPIDPNAYLDPNDPSQGTILNPKAPAFSEDLSPITLDYLTD
ncbi:MAG: PD-(D/E)XK nuclease family protein [Thermoguttaceae bacterium]|nr:PD-(D/E)XK nuclease family protein [Thermoguttaceae bacterium]